ncbi:Protein of unknown function [Gryllus bimaculatus]|nr:Protein of unknown function [Gryllus bimaculatus]
MEGISILAENVIKIEDVKEEQVIKEECNWNCIEEVESSSISCSVKRENDSDEEELERPISVFVGPNEDQERVFRGEEKDPLSFCEEAFIKQEEASCSSGQTYQHHQQGRSCIANALQWTDVAQSLNSRVVGGVISNPPPPHDSAGPVEFLNRCRVYLHFFEELNNTLDRHSFKIFAQFECQFLIEKENAETHEINAFVSRAGSAMVREYISSAMVMVYIWCHRVLWFGADILEVIDLLN